jgi:hypothetical protein
MYKLQLIEQSIHDKHAHPTVATETIFKTDWSDIYFRLIKYPIDSINDTSFVF